MLWLMQRQMSLLAQISATVTKDDGKQHVDLSSNLFISMKQLNRFKCFLLKTLMLFTYENHLEVGEHKLAELFQQDYF